MGEKPINDAQMFPPFCIKSDIIQTGGHMKEQQEIIWCDKPYLRITSDVEPSTGVIKPLPSDNDKVKKNKKKFPYINRKRVVFTVDYLGTIYPIKVAKGFRWNGTNCLGLQHNPKLLDASMVHDLLCNLHSLVDNDRQLSSMIFREIGIASGVNKAFMWTAYHAVDNFQKLFGKDLEGKKWDDV